MGDFGNRYHVFTDALFDGNEYTLKLRVATSYNNDDDADTNEGDNYNIEPAYMELCVDLQHITKDYYLYLKSRASAWGNGDFGGMFSEPIQIYNNIQGGIGILGSYTSIIYILPL